MSTVRVPPEREAAVETSRGALTTWPHPSALGRDAWTDLLQVVADALRFSPPLYLYSVLGTPADLLDLHRYSEYRILDVWRFDRAVKYLLDATLPAIQKAPPPFGLPLVNSLIWRPTTILQRPDHNGNYTTFPDEAWIFVNGILTNDGVAHLNAALLADLFHRPLTIVQNSTGAVWADLVECALGKHARRVTESVEKAFPVIYDALKSDKARVVVIAHSQGTIIMSVVLRLLAESLRAREAATKRTRRGRTRMMAPCEPVVPDDWPIRLEEFEPVTRRELAKLEVYCFANCASTMTYVDDGRPGVAPVPWIESYGNEYDLVARLGMLAPNPEERGIRIDGPRYVRCGAWGHLLNDHYLAAIEDEQRVGHSRGGKGGAAPYERLDRVVPQQSAPRLFGYINGGVPRGGGPR